MDFSRLKIPIKELPLVALGITAVLISSILHIPFVEFLLIGMFFGLLSKKTRWTFWGTFLLIDGFSSFRFLLRTDRTTMIADTLVRGMVVFGNSSFSSTPILDNSSITMVENFFVSVGSNPIFSNPIFLTFSSVVSTCLVVILWVITIVTGVGYVLVLLPIFGHTLLMLCIFNRNMLPDVISALSTDTASLRLLPDMAKVITPYLLQGIVIQVLLMTAICPLIFYKILKRIGFYKRIPGVHS